MTSFTLKFIHYNRFFPHQKLYLLQYIDQVFQPFLVGN